MKYRPHDQVHVRGNIVSVNEDDGEVLVDFGLSRSIWIKPHKIAHVSPALVPGMVLRIDDHIWFVNNVRGGEFRLIAEFGDSSEPVTSDTFQDRDWEILYDPQDDDRFQSIAW